MINLNEYVMLLRVLQWEIKQLDNEIAYNIARELSMIYLKPAFDIPAKGSIDRLESLGAYTKKALGERASTFCNLIDDIVINYRNSLNLQG